MECGNDVLGEELDLAHLLLPRHEALIEEPAKPFEITLAAQRFELLDVPFYLVDGAGERVFGFAIPLDGPLGLRQHGRPRVFFRVLRQAERLGKTEAIEVMVKTGKAVLVALISFLGCSVAAQGHQIDLTNARVVVLPDRMVDLEIAMKGTDVDRAPAQRYSTTQPVSFSPRRSPERRRQLQRTSRGTRQCSAGMASRAGLAKPRSRRMATASWSAFLGSALLSRTRCGIARRC
jgi:hypothetical protein